MRPVLHVRAHEQRAAFCYQLLSQLAPTTCPTARTCVTSLGSALTESIGIGKGSVHRRRCGACDLIVIAGQNPGTTTADAYGIGEGKGQRRQDHCGEPTGPRPSDPIQGSAEGEWRCGAWHSIADEFVQIRIGGTWPLFAGWQVVARGRRPAPGTVIDRAFVRRRIAPGSTSIAPHNGDRLRRGARRHRHRRANSNAFRDADGVASAPSSAGRWA